MHKGEAGSSSVSPRTRTVLKGVVVLLAGLEVLEELGIGGEQVSGAAF